MDKETHLCTQSIISCVISSRCAIATGGPAPPSALAGLCSVQRLPRRESRKQSGAGCRHLPRIPFALTPASGVCIAIALQLVKDGAGAGLGSFCLHCWCPFHWMGYRAGLFLRTSARVRGAELRLWSQDQLRGYKVGAQEQAQGMRASRSEGHDEGSRGVMGWGGLPPSLGARSREGGLPGGGGT